MARFTALVLALFAMSAEAFNFGGKPKPAPAKITKKEPEAATGSKQRSYKIGGKTPGPELYDDGLTDLERRLVQEGKTAALAGAAKQRGIFVQGKGF